MIGNGIPALLFFLLKYLLSYRKIVNSDLALTGLNNQDTKSYPALALQSKIMFNAVMLTEWSAGRFCGWADKMLPTLT